MAFLIKPPVFVWSPFSCVVSRISDCMTIEVWNSGDLIGFADRSVGIPSKMTSRMKEDEKNEATVRRLLKLPENKRCINCNSLVCFLRTFYYWLCAEWWQVVKRLSEL